MSARRAIGVAALAVLVAAAALVLVLGIDVLRWRGQLERADLRFGVTPGDTSMWEPDTRLPVSWSRGLVGVSDDIAFRRALQRFRLGRPGEPARDQHDLALRAQAQFDLAAVAAAEHNSARRSRAKLLQGVLELEEARSNGPRAGVALRRAVQRFQEAIRADWANEDAKYDLELVLRLIQANGASQGQESQKGQRPGGHGRGAGSSSNQSGY